MHHMELLADLEVWDLFYKHSLSVNYQFQAPISIISSHMLSDADV